MKIKVFKFVVCNAASHPLKNDDLEDWYRKKINEIITPEEIENKINDFIESVAEVIDIKVNQIDEKWHNNGRGNTVSFIYTVLYKD